MRRTSSLVFPLACLLLVCQPALGGKFNRVLSVGDDAPEWRGLVGVDGGEHALADYEDARLVVLVFLSNNCPVAQAYQEPLVSHQEQYAERGVQLVAVNSNPGQAEDLESMQERAEEQGYNFPYLDDEEQDLGRAYGALRTPTVFVLDPQRRIAYMGAIDDSRGRTQPARHHYLTDALDALLDGRSAEVAETKPSGCEIPYREK